MDKKKQIYDELCRVLTDFENMEATEEDLYNMLCKMQNSWEDIITVEEQEAIKMNAVRERVLDDMKPYMEFYKHKDLIAFSLGESYVCYDDETDAELEADFNEIIVVVEKDWLFNIMKEDGIKNPLDYLQNEYTWDDSYFWFLKAKDEGKIVVIEFN